MDYIEETIIAPCPLCGADAPFRVERGRTAAPAWQRCDACWRDADARVARLSDEMDERCSGMSHRTRNALYRSFKWHDAPTLWEASDAYILSLPMIGPKALEEFRSYWPRPRATSGPPEIPADFWLRTRDVFAMVGG